MQGTTLQATVKRVVDGDTIWVEEIDKSLRVLAIDTEESSNSSNKPVTPWGKEAKAEAERLFNPGDSVTIEFPGNEDVETCLKKYRGNYGRPLVYLHLADGHDFQEHMIREGYSPYFMKYGHADFQNHRERYIAAERDAQIAFRGVWDQIGVNGSEARNYAALGVWWELRGAIIDRYREHRRANPGQILNSRLDYEQIKQDATPGDATVTIFTELRDLIPVGGQHGIVVIGSQQQPFKIFIPDISENQGPEITSLLETRYFSSGETHPKRSYAYVTGQLKLFRDEPEVVVTDPDQIRDLPP